MKGVINFLNNPWSISIIGGTLAIIFAAVLIYYFHRVKEYIKINRGATIQKGIALIFGQIIINLRKGKIQEIPGLNGKSAVVLPANTSFIDDCIRDSNSALGAFALKYYHNRIPNLQQDIKKQLITLNYPKNTEGFYPLGTSIILPNEYDTPAKIIITASTVRKELSGIRAEPSSVCECIHQVFLRTADKKIENLYMPILGSGHGGMEINDALFFLILAIKHYSKFYHHVKSVDILAIEKDVLKLKDVYRLQYLTLLEKGVNK